MGTSAVLQADEGHRRPLEALGPVEGGELHDVVVGIDLRAARSPPVAATQARKLARRWRRGPRRRVRRPARASARGCPVRPACRRPEARVGGLGRGSTRSARALRRGRPGGMARQELGQRAAALPSPSAPAGPSRKGIPACSRAAATGPSRALVRARTARCDQGRPGPVQPGAATGPRPRPRRRRRRSRPPTGNGPSGTACSAPVTEGPRSRPENGPGGGDDLGRRPVVGVEAQDDGAREELGEPVEEGGVGPVPPVDGLAGVADHEEVGAARARP